MNLKMSSLSGNDFIPIKNMIPQDFASRTREQRKEFDEIKGRTFERSEEELKEEVEQWRYNMLRTCQFYLEKYGIKFTGNETDFSELWKTYIIGDGSDNPPMNEWLGNVERLEEIVATKIKDNNNIEDFMNFVLSYET